MTLLRHDRDSKRDLLSRLDRIKKERAQAEVSREHEQVLDRYATTLARYGSLADAYSNALNAEAEVEESVSPPAGCTGLATACE